MTSKIIVNTIEADTGISSVTFASNINLQNDSSILVSSSGIRLGTGSTIAAPSANEITLSTNSAERLRIDSAGRLLLGTTTAGNGNADNLTLADSGNCGITIRSGTSNFGEIYFSDATSGGGEYDGWIAYSHSSRYMVLATAQTERLRITSAGNVDINGTPPWTVTGGNYRNLSISGSDASSSGFLWLGNGAAATNADFDLGRVNFVNGTNIVAQIKGTTQTSANDDGRISFLTKSTGSNIAERLRITSDGKVGINETAPDRLLHLKAASSTAYSGGSDTADYNFLKIENTTNDKSAGIFFQIGGNGEAAITATEVVDGNTDIAFQNRGSGVRSEKVRITSAGRMGVGTNDPSALLEVRDSENTTKGAAQIRISKGVGNGAAPTSVSRADSYLHIGGSEYHTSFGRYNIAFGYTNDEYGSGIPAYIGFVETTLAGYTKGDLVFGTRGNTTATNNPTERMRIDSDGVITMPYQPAFHSRGGTSLSASTNNVIIGGATEFNTGGHYSTSNGRFTAPVDGVYQFSFWGLLYVHSSGVINIYYSKNGTQYAHLIQGGADSTNHTSRSGTVLMGMSAGDYAELRINPGSTGANAYGSQWNMSGHLVG